MISMTQEQMRQKASEARREAKALQKKMQTVIMPLCLKCGVKKTSNDYLITSMPIPNFLADYVSGRSNAKGEVYERNCGVVLIFLRE